MIVRRSDTEMAREFWRRAEEAAREVSTWPAWRRAGINVAYERPEPDRLALYAAARRMEHA